MRAGNELDQAQVLEVVIQTLDILQAIHSVGYTYNDLKPDNIMMNNDKHRKLRLTLTDFGLASKYNCEDKQEVFLGNYLFASLNQLEFKVAQPKDDLISLCYMMFYLLNGCDLPEF